MSKVEKSSEPSMDEILNSIRKIIADDSTGNRPPQPPSAVPLPPPGNASFNTPLAAAPPPPLASRSVPPPTASAVDDVLDDFARATPAARASPPAPTPPRADPNVPSWLTSRTPSTPAADKPAAPAPAPPPPHLTVKPFFSPAARDAPAASTETPPSLAPVSPSPDRPAPGSLSAFVPTRPEAQSPPPSLPDFVLPPERRSVAATRVDVDPAVNGRGDHPETSQTAHATSHVAVSQPPPSSDRSPPADQPGAIVSDLAATPRTGEAVPHTQVLASPAARPDSNGAAGIDPVGAKASAPATETPPTPRPAATTNGSISARSVAPSPQSSNGAAKDDMVITGPPLAPNRPPVSPASIPSPSSGPTPAAQISARVSPTPPTQGPAPQHVVSTSRPAAGAPGGPVRTMEDTVVELLRPMLRQWLDANMPRIVEKALRVELSEDGKKKH